MPCVPGYRAAHGMAIATGPRPRTAVGIGVAVGVYGVSFGVLAVAAGMSAAQACVMSMLVFTGASQFAFVGVLAAGGGALAAMGPAVMLAAAQRRLRPLARADPARSRCASARSPLSS